MTVSTLHPTPAFRCCPLCSKPIGQDSAYARHVSYCRRSQTKERKRKRSCRQCSSAKAKCSFESVCSRCQSRGLPCSYDGTQSLVLPPAASLDTSVSTALTTTEIAPSPCFGSAASIELPPTAPRLVMTIWTDPLLRHSADFLLEAFRALPRMMSRRATYDWYVHGQWHETEFPDTLTKCAEISKLYLSGAPGDKSDFFAAVKMESQKLLRGLPLATKYELLINKQVLMAYLAMAAVEIISTHGIPEVPLDLLMANELNYNKVVAIDNFEPLLVAKMGDPHETWEDWIYNESRRRTALLYLLVSRVMDIRFGARCPSILGFRDLPLPSPSDMWLARTREEWYAARLDWLKTRESSLQTYGDLIEARASADEPKHRRQLDDWHATCDKLGLLLTMATVMV